MGNAYYPQQHTVADNFGIVVVGIDIVERPDSVELSDLQNAETINCCSYKQVVVGLEVVAVDIATLMEVGQVGRLHSQERKMLV